MQKETDVLIIGAGPAGLTAAIYVCRAGLKAAVVERIPCGGQAGILGRIANYPGIKEISGYELVSAMTEQAKGYGCEFIAGTVAELRPGKRSAVLSNGDAVRAERVILATGVRPKRLGVPREDELIGRGVSYCATCDGAFFKGRPVAVAGDGSQARGAAAYLSRLASEVYFITAEGSAPEGTTLVTGSVTELVGAPLDGVVVSGPSGTRTLRTDCLFVSAGYEPNSDIVRGICALDGEGYVLADGSMATSDPWVYAAGDVIQKDVRQIVTAAGDGAVAGCAVVKEINKERRK